MSDDLALCFYDFGHMIEIWERVSLRRAADRLRFKAAILQRAFGATEACVRAQAHTYKHTHTHTQTHAELTHEK